MKLCKSQSWLGSVSCSYSTWRGPSNSEEKLFLCVKVSFLDQVNTQSPRKDGSITLCSFTLLVVILGLQFWPQELEGPSLSLSTFLIGDPLSESPKPDKVTPQQWRALASVPLWRNKIILVQKNSSGSRSFGTHFDHIGFDDNLSLNQEVTAARHGRLERDALKLIWSSRNPLRRPLILLPKPGNRLTSIFEIQIEWVE